MVSKKDVMATRVLTKKIKELETRNDTALTKEIKETERIAKLLEYTVEHLNPSALIAVHQTNYFPQKGIILPNGHGLLSLYQNTSARNIINDLQLKYPRMTVHFTLNYPVEGVSSKGSWITWDAKYAVLVPVKDIITRVVCLNPVDTWVIGKIALPKSAEIIIREDEYNVNPKSWITLAGKAKIITFPQNKKLADFIKYRIVEKGYTTTIAGDHGWYESDDLLYISRFINKSTFLTYTEKDHLIAIAANKGYQNWNQVFWAMAAKFQKETLPHFHTLWNQIEVLTEDVYGVMFDPSYRERQKLLPEITVQLQELVNQLKRHKTKVESFITERKELSPSKEESESLTMLIFELNRLQSWLESIIQKVSHELNKNTATWEQFLIQEKIID